MKKLFAILALCLIFIGIGYGVGVLTGDYSLIAIAIYVIGFFASVAVIGAIYWLLEYIGKN
jgi:hypothetical protein